ncbi:hypothetical protein BLS_005957 [Venturia inaequalis]|uniref:Riboflavin kinase n=1 Tax=Venturia inaequalis TaxID=5025 RepID=A0A8H3UF04_VENIN|nr:hypothetical protein BLS_005957 [Venturia inaequalis]KAE9974350.1 hypothetical protein EG327_008806 [Venturia inaequalis]KAE9978064.1 hypothetical protein EG328_001684 [Venturia inaequalis]
MKPDGPRDPIAGPDSGPEPPFPIKLGGKVIKGFGRGSKELGIPTANIPLSGLTIGGQKDLESGIYYGWAGLDYPSSSTQSPSTPQSPSSTSTTPARRPSISERVQQAGAKLANGVSTMVGSTTSESEGDTESEGLRGTVYPMVMSVGWNPFYKNTVRSVEVHILHLFPTDFYNLHLNLIITGFIRPEYDYVSKESLIEDIMEDIEVTKRSLARPAYKKLEEDPYLRTFPREGDEVPASRY